jgi:hypothetical protein
MTTCRRRNRNRGLERLFVLLLALPWGSGCFDVALDDPGGGALDFIANGPALSSSAVLLAVPQDSSTGILGAVLDTATGVPVATLQAVQVDSVFSESAAHFAGLREFSIAAGVAADATLVEADIGVSAVTHVAYDVWVESTRYLVGPPAYETDSGCCLAGGVPSDSCRSGYVTRVYVGDGKVTYLASLDAHASAGAGPVAMHAGVRYRVLAEQEFWGSVFAVEVGDMSEVCRAGACRERTPDGRCIRCAVAGSAADSLGFHAPAAGVLRLSCWGMVPEAAVVVAVQGEVRPDGYCWSGEDTVVGLEAETWGRTNELVPLGSLTVSDGYCPSFSVESPALRTSGCGLFEVQLNVTDCLAGGEPRRCFLSPDLELSVRLLPGVDVP